MKNPFEFVKYPGPIYFCDRKEETNAIVDAIDNGRSLTIFSIRRLGKTGLIHHAFNQLRKKKNHKCIYLDIYSCQNQKDFLEQFSAAVIHSLEDSKEGFMQSASKFFNKYRPRFS